MQGKHRVYDVNTMHRYQGWSAFSPTTAAVDRVHADHSADRIHCTRTLHTNLSQQLSIDSKRYINEGTHYADESEINPTPCISAATQQVISKQ